MFNHACYDAIQNVLQVERWLAAQPSDSRRAARVRDLLAILSLTPGHSLASSGIWSPTNPSCHPTGSFTPSRTSVPSTPRNLPTLDSLAYQNNGGSSATLDGSTREAGGMTEGMTTRRRDGPTCGTPRVTDPATNGDTTRRNERHARRTTGSQKRTKACPGSVADCTKGACGEAGIVSGETCHR
jgi:hypothetical protein